MSRWTIVSIWSRLAKWLGLVAAAVLLLFTARRWLFTWVVARARPRLSLPTWAPPVLALTPLRDEAAALPGFLAAWEEVAYSAENLTLVLIDDASTDATPAILRAWAAARLHCHILTLPQRVGKAQALNLALAAYPRGELIAVYDADERPTPDALRRLIAPLADSRVAAVSGRRTISNAADGPAAAYAALESLVHQNITLTAKDALTLAPPSLGSHCVYRRSALQAVGGFRPGALLEDSDLSLRLARQGWRLRYTPDAVSRHAAPATLRGYWRQHTRWARGFYETAWVNRRSPQPARRQQNGWLRGELALFAVGYLDRLAFLLGLGLAARQRWLRPILALSLLTPAAQIALVWRRAGAPWALRRQWPWLPFFWGVDMAAAVWGAGAALLRRPRVWESRAQRA